MGNPSCGLDQSLAKIVLEGQPIFTLPREGLKRGISRYKQHGVTLHSTTAAVTGMQFLHEKSKGTLIMGLSGGFAGGVSTLLAILAYRQWGWNIFVTMPIVMLVLLMALLPVTKKHLQR